MRPYCLRHVHARECSRRAGLGLLLGCKCGRLKTEHRRARDLDLYELFCSSSEVGQMSFVCDHAVQLGATACSQMQETIRAGRVTRIDDLCEQVTRTQTMSRRALSSLNATQTKSTGNNHCRRLTRTASVFWPALPVLRPTVPRGELLPTVERRSWELARMTTTSSNHTDGLSRHHA